MKGTLIQRLCGVTALTLALCLVPAPAAAQVPGQLNYFFHNWGLATDRPVPADYIGNGAADLAVFRPGENNWYVLRSSTNTMMVVNWGLDTDVLVPADYGLDCATDFAVYRPSEGNWYVLENIGPCEVTDPPV